MCHAIKILISTWPRTRKFSQLLQAGKTVAFDFAHHGSLWSRSTSNFYTLIGQNLTVEFMRKIYTASWILFTFVSTYNVFNSLFSLHVQNEIQLLSGVFCSSWLVGFWLRNTSLVKFGNPISDGIIFVFHLAWYVRVAEKSDAILALLDTFQELHLEW